MSTPIARFSLRNVLLLAVPALLIAGGIMGYLYLPAQTEKADLPGRVLRYVAGVTQLDKDFNDADDDLVADPPPISLDASRLRFFVLENETSPWEGFRRHLEKRVNMPVELRVDEARQDLPKKFKAGELHLAAVSTGMVPTMVNTAGFVPAFCMANDRGEYAYKVHILVGADSPIKTLQDLKGRTLTLTSLGSLSSFKAPIQALEEAGLGIDKDYEIQFSSGQRGSIDGLAQGRYQAIAVASDLYQRTLKTRDIPESKFRVIYESKETYPPACFGYHHALRKELADQIQAAFAEYVWDANMQREFGPGGYTKFVPVSYKSDWHEVRKIDDKIGRILQRK